MIGIRQCLGIRIQIRNADQSLVPAYYLSDQK